MLPFRVVLKEGRQGKSLEHVDTTTSMTEAEKLPWYRLVKLFGRTTDEALSQGNTAAHVDG